MAIVTPMHNGEIIRPQDVLSYMQSRTLAEHKMNQWHKFLQFKRQRTVPIWGTFGNEFDH